MSACTSEVLQISTLKKQIKDIFKYFSPVYCRLHSNHAFNDPVFPFALLFKVLNVTFRKYLLIIMVAVK